MTDVEKLTKIFIKIRDARAAASAEFKAKDSELERQMDAVRGAILEYMKEQNLESVRTGAGLVYRTVKTRYWTNDWESMGRFIIENELPEFFEKRLNQGVVKEYLEQHPDQTPPGLNVDSKYEVTVRKA